MAPSFSAKIGVLFDMTVQSSLSPWTQILFNNSMAPTNRFSKCRNGDVSASTQSVQQ